MSALEIVGLKNIVMYRFSENQILFGFLQPVLFFGILFRFKKRFKNRLLNLKPDLKIQNQFELLQPVSKN